MSKALSMVLHVGTGTWSLGYVENHSARPMTKEELEAHIKEFNENKTQLSTEKSAREKEGQRADGMELAGQEQARRADQNQEAMLDYRRRAEAAEKACAEAKDAIENFIHWEYARCTSPYANAIQRMKKCLEADAGRDYIHRSKFDAALEALHLCISAIHTLDCFYCNICQTGPEMEHREDCKLRVALTAADTILKENQDETTKS